LVDRLRKFEEKTTSSEEDSRHVAEFLGLGKRRYINDLPTIQSHYHHEFNHVDKLNKKIHEIVFRTRFSDVPFRTFVGLVEIAIAQAWTLINDWENENKNKKEIREIAKEIAKEINLEVENNKK
jgi:hypothetical protein